MTAQLYVSFFEVFLDEFHHYRYRCIFGNNLYMTAQRELVVFSFPFFITCFSSEFLEPDLDEFRKLFSSFPESLLFDVFALDWTESLEFVLVILECELVKAKGSRFTRENRLTREFRISVAVLRRISSTGILGESEPNSALFLASSSWDSKFLTFWRRRLFSVPRISVWEERLILF